MIFISGPGELRNSDTRASWDQIPSAAKAPNGTCPLPGDIQMTAIYTPAIATNAENAMDARPLLNELRRAATPAAKLA